MKAAALSRIEAVFMGEVEVASYRPLASTQMAFHALAGPSLERSSHPSFPALSGL